jgi:hypothetical protein
VDGPDLLRELHPVEVGVWRAGGSTSRRTPSETPRAPHTSAPPGRSPAPQR